MKKLLFLFAVTVICTCLLAFSAAHHRMADIFHQLNISEPEARDYIFSNLWDGALQSPFSEPAKNLSPDRKAQAVKQIGDYIRQFTASPEFAEKYAAEREAAKPQGPASEEEVVKKRLASIEHDIGVNENDMKKATGDMKKLYEGTIKSLKDEQKSLQNPGSANYRSYVEMLMENEGGNSAQYAEDMKYFQQNYPPTVKGMLKKRLQAFLDLTATIDFNAKLVQAGRVKKFADPALEAKDGDWKRCFRAGKETIGAARVYAQGWMKELQ